MSSFTEAQYVEVEPRTRGVRSYRALCGFRFYVGFVGSSQWVEVPDGAIFDISFSAWLLRILPSGWARCLLLPAAVHDLLREDLRYSKFDGDCLFLTAMRATRTPWPLMWVAFFGVLFNRSRSGAVWPNGGKVLVVSAADQQAADQTPRIQRVRLSGLRPLAPLGQAEGSGPKE